MPMLARPSEPAPMLEINTTPLIDVMLVLIIMLIITIPMQTHSVKLDLPRADGTQVNSLRNVVTITEQGSVQWNGRPLGMGELAGLLAATTQLPSEPELHLQPAPEAPYRVVDEVLVITKRAGVQKFGFVGNQAYARF